MNEHNQKHLTLSNRTYIEQELLQKSTFSSIEYVVNITGKSYRLREYMTQDDDE